MKNLEDLRKAINRIDQALLELIKRHLDVANQVGEVKKLRDLDVKDPKREEQVIGKLSESGQSLGITREVIEKVWKTLFKISYRIEK